MSRVQRQLSDVLLDQGLVTQDLLDFAAAEEARTGRSAWKILIDQGALAERDLVRARAAQIDLPFVDVRTEQPSPDALALLPHEAAARQSALPLRRAGDALVVAMSEPTNHLALQEIASLTGVQVAPAAAYRADLQEAIARLYAQVAPEPGPAGPPPAPGAPAAPGATPGPQAPGDPSGTVVLEPGDFTLTEAPAEPEAAQTDEEELKEPNLSEFLIALVEGTGSDLHLTVGVPPMVRVHGELRPIRGFRELTANDIQQMIYAILTQKQREIFEDRLELDLSYQLPGMARFRVNVFQQRESLGAVMRLIPFGIKTLDQLGLPHSVHEFTRLRRGLVLVTGITGSGKSTTLAGMVDIINEDRAEHIMTVEDPIEFLHHHKRSIVNQREVGTDTQGFAIALKHVLRQDPDVILVGEMRDLETIQTALTAAETGHLVFGTLHTQDAPQSIDRVIDVFPPHQQQQIRVQLSGTIAGVVSQQLLPTADGKGRVVAVEVLVATPAVRNLIREGKTHQIYTAMQAGGKFGMQVMDQHLAQLVKQGKVTYDMALERCHQVSEFNRLVGRG